MPASLNGFGTCYYGECDYQRDGSFVTTEWLIFAYFPMWPLSSLRLIRHARHDKNFIFYHSEGYIRVREEPLKWAQVFRVWFFVTGMFFWTPISGFSVMAWNDRWPGHGWLLFAIWAVIVGLPWILPFALRHRAKAHATFSEEALIQTLESITESSSRTASPPPLPVSKTPPPLPQ